MEDPRNYEIDENQLNNRLIAQLEALMIPEYLIIFAINMGKEIKLSIWYMINNSMQKNIQVDGLVDWIDILRFEVKNLLSYLQLLSYEGNDITLPVIYNVLNKFIYTRIGSTQFLLN